MDISKIVTIILAVAIVSGLLVSTVPFLRFSKEEEIEAKTATTHIIDFIVGTLIGLFAGSIGVFVYNKFMI